MLQPSVPAWFEIPVADIDRAQRIGHIRDSEGNRVGLASVEVAR